MKNTGRVIACDVSVKRLERAKLRLRRAGAEQQGEQHSYRHSRVSTATGAPRRDNGRMRSSLAPGLGIEPIASVLGDPLVTVK